jgi:hypothetical protein
MRLRLGGPGTTSMSAKFEDDRDFSDAVLKPSSVRASRLVKVHWGLIVIGVPEGSRHPHSPTLRGRDFLAAL